MASIEVVNWWKEKHQYPGSCAFKSDDGGPGMWESLGIQKFLLPDTNILEIGVGLGKDIKELNKLGINVYALDICEEAMKVIQNVIKGYWLHSTLDDLPSNFFDVCISHLVSQHMNNDDFKDQLKNVIRSLKSTGRLAIQYAQAKVDNSVAQLSEIDMLGAEMMGGVLRTVNEVKMLVENSGGYILQDFEMRKGPNWVWRCVHIGRKNLL